MPLKCEIFWCYNQDYLLFSEENLTVLISVLGLARTGLIFTGIQEGVQPGGGG